MPDPAPDAPRYLHDRDTHTAHDRDTPTADTTAAVDVTELLARVAELTEELAEARVQQKHAEAELERRTRQVNIERQAHNATRQRLEDDSQALVTECDLLAAESRGLEAEVARERNARTAVEEDLKRVQDRTAALQDKLRIAGAQRRQNETEAPEQPPWWRRLGS
jgi:chromosome segregation ATPase